MRPHQLADPLELARAEGRHPVAAAAAVERAVLGDIESNKELNESSLATSRLQTSSHAAPLHGDPVAFATSRIFVQSEAPGSASQLSRPCVGVG
jgi:hypothetical protein